MAGTDTSSGQDLVFFVYLQYDELEYHLPRSAENVTTTFDRHCEEGRMPYGHPFAFSSTTHACRHNDETLIII